MNRQLSLLSLVCVLAVCVSAMAGDWPQWRGPQRNGVAGQTPQALPAEKPEWTMDMLGECHAGIAAADGKVLVPDYGKQTDALYCLEAKTGKKIWAYSVPNTEEMDYNAGARITPLIADGKVYMVDAFGQLVCLNLADGKKVYAVDFVDGYDAAVPEWGFSGSPMIADGKLIVPVGGKDATLVALEPATGKLIWKAKGSGMGYASPVIGTLGGVVQVVTYDDYGVNGWELKTGKKLWAIEPEEAWDYSVPSPLLVNGKLLTVHSSWAQLFEFKDGGKINDEPIATNEDVYTEMDTPVLLGDKVLASGGGLFLLDPEKKLKVLWKDYDNELYLSGMTHIIAGKDKALVFSEPGNVGLVTLQADGKLKLEGTRKLADKTWAAPAMMDGRIFIRDSKKLYCYPVKTEAIKPAKASE